MSRDPKQEVVLLGLRSTVLPLVEDPRTPRVHINSLPKSKTMCVVISKTPELLESTVISFQKPKQKNCVVINLVKHEEPSLHQPNGFLITSQPSENRSTHIAQVFHRTEWILDLTSGHRWTLVILTHPDRLDSNNPSLEKSG